MRYIIIGAGPAGLATGIQVLLESQKTSIVCECVIIEKDISKPKPCGGLLTPKSHELLQYLGINLDFLTCHNSINVGYSKQSFSYSTSQHFYVCQRQHLIDELSYRFLSLGGIIVQDTVISADYSDHKVIGKRDIYRYDFLVIATGNKVLPSTISAQSKSSTKLCPIGVSAEVSLKKCPVDASNIHIWFFRNWEGYGWCFPLDNGKANVGFAGMLKKKNCRKTFDYVQKQFEEILGYRIPKYQGCILPMDYYRKWKNKAIPDGIFEVGESGKYFDSLTGEGIYFAIYTGILTAKYVTGSIPQEQYRCGIENIRYLCSGSTFTRKLLFAHGLFISLLLRIAKYMKKIDVHLTEKLILSYKYDYFSAYLSPIFCYCNIDVPFDIQRKLDEALELRKGSYCNEQSQKEQKEN